MKQIMGVVASLVGAGVARAQEVAGPAAGSLAPQAMDIRQILETGGWLMYVLGAMSIAVVALILYFVLALRREQVVPAALLERVRADVRAGRLVEAEAACRANSSAMAAILAAALEYAIRSPKPDPGLLREIVEGEGGRQATMIQNQTQYLLDIGVIAPMVGLLGTVMGMLTAFNAVALDLAKAKPMLLAGGVSQALITTVAGLMVAIPAMIAYAFFRGRTSRLISDMEKSAAELITLFAKV